ncbi:MAG: DEAD/DEAH box helicase [Lachnospiraceae bacterium]|nr:DEAD/DEAH box helicase [Lachnospiraceae bacterium]
MENSLYQWQEECLKRWLDYGARGMVQAVTGSGKTRLALYAIDALEDRLGQEVFVKIVVPTSALMNQWARALRGHLAEKAVESRIGLRGGGRKDPTDRRYMISVINTARYELARQILKQLENGQTVLLIADECHHYAKGENALIFEFLEKVSLDTAAYYSLGLSATLPVGSDGEALTKALGPRIYTYSMVKAASTKTVSPVDLFHVALSFRDEELEEYEAFSEEILRCYTRLKKRLPALDKMDLRDRFAQIRKIGAGKDQTARMAQNYLNLTYKRKSLVCLAADRIVCAQELIRRISSREKIMVFGERIAQAEELYQILSRQYPGRVGRCRSQMGEQANRNTLERFRTGEFRILITCKSMDEGVDIPDASVGIVLSGTAGQRQRIQRLGRIIRPREGKERAALYYLHVEESVEDACYLPDTGDSHVFEIAFLPQIRNFSNPAYEEAALCLMDEFEKKNSEPLVMREVTRCLDIGRVRGDWKLDPKVLDRRIEEADTTRERNYWNCMKRLTVIGQKHMTGDRSSV